MRAHRIQPSEVSARRVHIATSSKPLCGLWMTESAWTVTSGICAKGSDPVQWRCTDFVARVEQRLAGAERDWQVMQKETRER
jgi:hypothetical protein